LGSAGASTWRRNVSSGVGYNYTPTRMTSSQKIISERSGNGAGARGKIEASCSESRSNSIKHKNASSVYKRRIRRLADA